ncbi:MAG: ABC transporter permease [Promethearchaeota archaeon]
MSRKNFNYKKFVGLFLISISLLILFIREAWLRASLIPMNLIILFPYVTLIDLVLLLRLSIALILFGAGLSILTINFRGEKKTEGLDLISLGIAAISLSILVGAILMIIVNQDPIMGYYLMLRGALGNENRLATTITKVTPLILTGLSVAIAFRCGLFNIGAEGQLVLGAFTAALAGVYITGLPWFLHLPICLFAGAIAGAAAAFIPAYLKAKVGAHEVVTTIMMNGIIGAVTAWFVSSEMLLKDPDTMASQTYHISDSAQIPLIWEKTPFEGIEFPIEFLSFPFKGTTFHYGLLIAIGLAIIVYIIVWKTSLGYELRTVGLNPDAANYGGISAKRSIIITMLISGALAGIGGSIEILAIHYRFIAYFSPGYGFDGIAVAVLGQNTAIGSLISAFLFGGLASGGIYIDIFSDIPKEIVWVLQALVVLFVSAPMIIQRIKIPKIIGRRKEVLPSSTREISNPEKAEFSQNKKIDIQKEKSNIIFEGDSNNGN